jgi:hypothetical protein
MNDCGGPAHGVLVGEAEQCMQSECVLVKVEAKAQASLMSRFSDTKS